MSGEVLVVDLLYHQDRKVVDCSGTMIELDRRAEVLPKPPWVCVVQRRSSRRFCCLPMSTCREEGNEQRAGTGVRPSFYGLEEKLGPGQTTGKQLARR